MMSRVAGNTYSNVNFPLKRFSSITTLGLLALAHSQLSFAELYKPVSSFDDLGMTQ